jgi:cytochrome oxidase assembly protein ShyY1
VTYTPDAEGDLRILVLTNRGTFVGEPRSAPARQQQSLAIDLTGMVRPRHQRLRPHLCPRRHPQRPGVGTWYVYDAQGMPRWYTIQNVT